MGRWDGTYVRTAGGGGDAVTIHFNDVSHYQRNFVPRGPTIAKATQGLAMVDPTYFRYRDQTVIGGWPFAGYHYLTTDDTGGQALHALNVVGRQTPLMVDVEDGSGSLAHLLAFIAAYRKLGGLLTLVYVPRWYWAGTWGSPSLAPLAATGVKLISSAYPRSGYADNGIGWQPYGGMHPAIWQYTSTPIDTNAFRGTEAELRALFTGTHTPTGDVTDMPLTKTDAELVASTLLNTTVGATGPNVGVTLEQAATRADITALKASIDLLTKAITGATAPPATIGDLQVTGTLHVAPPAAPVA